MSTGEVRKGVFLAHRTALIDHATPILGSREAAEDIVQDAFLRFAPSPARIGSPEQTLAYLYRIVRNLAFDVLKHRRIEKRESDGGLPFWAMPQEEATPEQSLLLNDQVRIVSEVLATLPVEMRVAVEMHRFGGFTLEEVAEHLDISVATAHRHVRSALLAVSCPSSDDLRLFRCLRNGGSGSSGFEVMRPSADAASVSAGWSGA